MEKLLFTKDQTGTDRILKLLNTFKDKDLSLHTEVQCLDAKGEATIFINTTKETNITNFIYYEDDNWNNRCEMLVRVNFEKKIVHYIYDYELKLFQEKYDIKDRLYEEGYKIKEIEDEKYADRFFEEIRNILNKHIEEEDFMVKIALYKKKNDIYEKESNKLNSKSDTGDFVKAVNEIYRLHEYNNPFTIEKEIKNNLIKCFYHSKELNNLFKHCKENELPIEDVKEKLLSDYSCIEKINLAYEKSFDVMAYRSEFEKYFNFLEAKERKYKQLKNIVEEIRNQFGNRICIKFGDKKITKENIFVKTRHKKTLLLEKFVSDYTGKYYEANPDDEDKIMIRLGHYYWSSLIEINKNNVRSVLEQTTYRNKVIFDIDKLEKMFEEIDE